MPDGKSKIGNIWKPAFPRRAEGRPEGEVCIIIIMRTGPVAGGYGCVVALWLVGTGHLDGLEPLP